MVEGRLGGSCTSPKDGFGGGNEGGFDANSGGTREGDFAVLGVDLLWCGGLPASWKLLSFLLQGLVLYVWALVLNRK